MLKNILHNWRTSLLGTGALSGAVINTVQNPDDWKTSVSMLIMGVLGLVVADGHKKPEDNSLKG